LSSKFWFSQSAQLLYSAFANTSEQNFYPLQQILIRPFAPFMRLIRKPNV